jgi:alpha-N-arabinofuranosidase
VPGHCCNLGRETFLVPVVWDKGAWPVVAPGVGRILPVERAPRLPVYDPPSEPATDHFDGKRLGHAWVFVRTPREPFHWLDKRPGHLRLLLKKETLARKETGSPAFIGRRVQHASYAVRAKIELRPRAPHEAAGLAVRNGNHHLRVVKTRGARGEVVRVYAHRQDRDEVLAEAPAPPGACFLKIEARREAAYRFFVGAEPERWTPIGGAVDGRLLGHKAPGAQFTGATVGVYASSHGQPSTTTADYDHFEYQGERDD